MIITENSDKDFRKTDTIGVEFKFEKLYILEKCNFKQTELLH